MWRQDLIALGRKKGYLTHQDIKRYLPDDATTDDLEALLDQLEDLHLEVLDDGRSPLIEESPDDG